MKKKSGRELGDDSRFTQLQLHLLRDPRSSLDTAMCDAIFSESGWKSYSSRRDR